MSTIAFGLEFEQGAPSWTIAPIHLYPVLFFFSGALALANGSKPRLLKRNNKIHKQFPNNLKLDKCLVDRWVSAWIKVHRKL